MKNIKTLMLIEFVLVFLLSGCVTTNYYTGRTLKNGKTALTPGVDNLIWIVEDKGLVNKKLSFSPSIGISRGLPWRLETGIRMYLPYALETHLRHQVNPKSFEWFDVSANLHVGTHFYNRANKISDPYYKYGITISKEISYIQPYISYYLNKNYFIKNDVDDVNDYNVVCFGLAVPNGDDTIFYECNYYKNTPSGKGFFSIGIGFQVPRKNRK